MKKLRKGSYLYDLNELYFKLYKKNWEEIDLVNLGA